MFKNLTKTIKPARFLHSTKNKVNPREKNTRKVEKFEHASKVVPVSIEKEEPDEQGENHLFPNKIDEIVQTLQGTTRKDDNLDSDLYRARLIAILHDVIDEREKSKFDDMGTQILRMADTFGKAVNATDERISETNQRVLQRVRDLENTSISKTAANSMIVSSIERFEMTINTKLDRLDHMIDEHRHDHIDSISEMDDRVQEMQKTFPSFHHLESITSKLNDLEKRFEDKSTEILHNANHFSTMAVSVADERISETYQRVHDLETSLNSEVRAISSQSTRIASRVEGFEDRLFSKLVPMDETIDRIESRTGSIRQQIHDNLCILVEIKRTLERLETKYESARAVNKVPGNAVDEIESPAIPAPNNETTEKRHESKTPSPSSIDHPTVLFGWKTTPRKVFLLIADFCYGCCIGLVGCLVGGSIGVFLGAFLKYLLDVDLSQDRASTFNGTEQSKDLPPISTL
jgi:hypothetical protein